MSVAPDSGLPAGQASSATAGASGDSGDRGQLKRSLNFLGNLTLTLSDITPASSVFVIIPALLLATGTGIVYSFIVGVVLAFSIGLCMAELGSLYPTAGGPYYIVKRVLGKYVGFITLATVVGQAVVLPSSIALGVGTYLHTLYPSVSPSLVGCLTMVIAGAVAMIPISTNGYIAGIFLGLEVLAIGILTIIGLTHLNHSVDIFFANLQLNDGGTLRAVGTGAILAGVVQVLFAFHGYEQIVTFSEETHGKRRTVGIMLVIALAITVILEVTPSITTVLASQNLPNFLGSDSPVELMLQTNAGEIWKTIVLIGAMIAIFNASIAIILGFSRIMYSAARTQAWPPAVSRFLSRVHPRFRTPYVVTLLIGIVGALLCLSSSFINLIDVTSVLIAFIYGMLTIAVLVSRVKGPKKRPFKLPIWPVPPLIGLAGLVTAFTFQTLSDLLIVVGLLVAATLYYFLYLAKRDTEWSRAHREAAEDEGEELGGGPASRSGP